MTIQEFRVLVSFVSHGECSIYDAWKSTTSVPLPTAYKVTKTMEARGWLVRVREESSSTNSIQRVILRVTDGGRDVAEHMAAVLQDDVDKWRQTQGESA